MRTRKLLLLHFTTTLRESVIVFALLGFLVFYGAFSSGGDVLTRLDSKGLFQVYFLLLMMLVGYTVTFSLYFAPFLKKKTSGFYHLYLILPEDPSKLLMVEILPTLLISLLLTWGIGLVFYIKAPISHASWLVLPMIGGGLFTLGFGVLSLALMLQISNVRTLSVVLFLLIFVLVRVPQYMVKGMVRGNFSPDLATALLTGISALFALAGFLAIRRISPERVILSS
ncbi:hypothetical protein [Thermococcus celer]|uniref:ABC transporter permease n=1 Tax=Thermococcus celer Vu 13 = JCM 8558 TaxID=1293037 RepID=A0A218P2R4_THECE|nr:hypothetical protein [Thermococcus celer]ASI99211.1 hypothetical protein A3L02_06355 [Thermococcus celer Vu 13 = JCM 8558]